MNERRLGQVVQYDHVSIEPLLVRMFMGQRLFQFIIANDTPLICVDEEHISRFKTSLRRDPVCGNIEHADFGSHYNEIVTRNVVTSGPKPVAIEQSADCESVAENNCSRSIPRL